jgi:hypothetical protein
MGGKSGCGRLLCGMIQRGGDHAASGFWVACSRAFWRASSRCLWASCRCSLRKWP